jgi:citrate lyase subunit beta/citryl-CoA lyase
MDMKRSVAITGNAGPGIRSDCQVTLELKETGGINIELASKVEALYGRSIKELAKEILDFFDIKHASVRIDDSGALPFVISARLESAVKILVMTEKNFLPGFIKENNYSTTRDRFRFTRLYLPGNTPSLMINAGLHNADGIILDLEDSVAPAKKEEARILVRNALRQVNFYGAERMVRINQGNRGLEDLHFVIPHNVNLILIPKCEDPADVQKVDKEIAEIKAKHNIDRYVFLMPIIESALGVERSFEIAGSSGNIVAIAIGLEDYASDLGVPRTSEGRESLYARARLVVAAKAAGIQPIDSVFPDVADMESLRRNVCASKALGFVGMGCIHPRQISTVQKGYAPDLAEIENSKKIVRAYEQALKTVSGVVAVGSKMIDAPVVTRAQKIIDLATRLGLLSAGWADGEMTEEIQV